MVITSVLTLWRWQELREYFKHVEKVLDVKKDVVFNACVNSAQFDQTTNKWTVKTEDGRTARSTFLIIATGFAAKRHFPDWKGLDTFKGTIYHSSFWPESGVDVKGKKVAVIGTGSTGVQIAQECAKEAAELTVFQRTPNLALPMQQKKLSKEDQDKSKYDQFFKDRMKTFAGFTYEFKRKNTFDESPAEREAFYETLWQRGGFQFWLGTYKDMLFEMPANREAYNFWAKKTRARIHDPRKRDILAPIEPPHAFGTKRPSLEQNFYEMFNQPNVDVVDLKANPVVEIKPEGIVTADGKLHETDIVALATGFDSVTGGMKDMGLKSVTGEPLSETWKSGTWSYLGMTCSGYPNMFYLYAAHAPTAFSNGPSCVEAQGDWIMKVIKKMKDEGIAHINPTEEAQKAWSKSVNDIFDETLFAGTASWYTGANIPGKPVEALNYAGGLPRYMDSAESTLDKWDGFLVEAA